MGYYINLKTISIDKYFFKLEKKYLVPSRMMLKKNINDNLMILKKMGINTVYDIQQALKTKNKLKEFAKKSKLNEKYLTILLREINSTNPKPNKLNEFPGISKEIVSKLQSNGIKNTYQLFNYITSKKGRDEFIKKYNINSDEMLELTKLTDLSRIKWASPVAARIIYDIGYDTVEKMAKANYEELHEKINIENEKMQYFKGKISLNDSKIFIEAAKEVSLDIEY